MASALVGEVLGAMITPAVLISAGGTLVLSTSNRLGRIVDRVRVLASAAEELERNDKRPETARKRALIASQLKDLSRRALMLRSAVAALYVAIGFLISTSMGVGLLTFLGWGYSWLPVSLGLLGVSGLLWGTLLLVREAQLAISSSLEEMQYADRLLTEQGDAPSS